MRISESSAHMCLWVAFYMSSLRGLACRWNISNLFFRRCLHQDQHQIGRLSFLKICPGIESIVSVLNLTIQPRWKDKQYIIGNMSQRVRKLRIVNVLTQQSDILSVCSEETMEEIQARYWIIFGDIVQSYPVVDEIPEPAGTWNTTRMPPVTRGNS